MTLKQHWKAEHFYDAADLANHLEYAGITPEQLERLNNGDLDAVTFRQAAVIAEGLFLTVDELLQLATEKRPARAKKLAAIRKAKGVTLEQAAETVENLPGMYQAKERGVVDFYAADLTALGKFLAVKPSEIFPGEING